MIDIETFKTILHAVGMAPAVYVDGKLYIPRDALLAFLASLSRPSPRLVFGEGGSRVEVSWEGET